MVMTWIVVGQEKEYIKLVSKSGIPGLLPKGSYLTVENDRNKHILRVDESIQYEPYSPSPLIIDMNFSPLRQDQKCQNIIFAKRVKDLCERDDGFIDFLPSQSIARRSTKEEVALAISSGGNGPEILLATVHSSQNHLLIDNHQAPISVKLPKEMFFHQISICGKTGGGKTVGSKYFAQYFVEELDGAVLTINVKDDDFLKMDQATITKSQQVQQEWRYLDLKPHGIENFTVYNPPNDDTFTSPGVNRDLCESITLNVKEIEPDALTGLIRGITDVGAQNLPNIFRYWQVTMNATRHDQYSFGDFVRYFSNAENDGRRFTTMNAREEVTADITLHPGTFHNLLRNLIHAQEFFDDPDAKSLNWGDVLYPGKMSVINVACKSGIEFGSILLRHLLKKIVEAKSKKWSKVPILIIIDEVHQFYNSESSKSALGDIDIICRTGRSQEIGVIFSSQNQKDIPKGLESVINTKIFFKTDSSSIKSHGLNFLNEEIENLKEGYAAVSIHNMSQVKFVKFPLSLSGVFEKED